MWVQACGQSTPLHCGDEEVFLDRIKKCFGLKIRWHFFPVMVTLMQLFYVSCKMGEEERMEKECPASVRLVHKRKGRLQNNGLVLDSLDSQSMGLGSVLQKEVYSFFFSTCVSRQINVILCVITTRGRGQLCVLSIGQILEFLGELEENEHWWRVRDEDGNEGCVPASYVIKKEHQVP